MRKLILMAAFLAVQAGAMAQDIKSENLQDFGKVYFSGRLKVTMEKSDRNGIEITLTDSGLEKLDWGVVDGTLSVKLKPSAQRMSFGEITIYYRSISSVKAIGTSVKFNQPLQSGLFYVDLSSGSTMTADVTADDMTVNVDSNSSASIDGKAKYLTVTANMKSKVDMRAFEARAALVGARYGAEVFVWATEKMDASSTGGSSVYYKGNPDILKVSEKTLGTVEQIIQN